MHAHRVVIAALACWIGLCGALHAEDAGKVVFSRPFAPADPIIAPQEQPYRDGLLLNGRWQFQAMPLPTGFQRDQGNPPPLPPPISDRWDTVPIKIPSPWNVNTWGNGRDVGAGTNRPYAASSLYFPSYPVAWDHAEMAWMRRRFRVPHRWAGKRLVLHFEAVAGDCDVLVNGHAAGRHFDSFLPFDLDVTDLVRLTGDNDLRVGVRAANLFNKRSPKYAKFLKPYPDGSALDGICGIWQDVSLRALPAVRVDDSFVQPLVARHLLKVQVTLRNDTAAPQRVSVTGDVRPWINLAAKDTLHAPEPAWKLGTAALILSSAPVSVPPHSSATVTLSAPAPPGFKPWTPQTPNLYGLVISASKGTTVVDRQFTRFGWRELTIRGRDLLLNGKKIQLFGDLCHPFGPFMMSRRFAWAWYRMIKDEGGNAVRLHAQPFPRCFLDMADEAGILVLDEDALFGSSIALNLEEPDAWARFHQHFSDLIHRDRNHPSVFGWSFGNEMFAVLSDLTPEDTAKYRAQLVGLGRSAFALDPTRTWISCDGDQDLGGALPTWSRHFGLGLPLKDLPDSSVNKPLMVGESGGTYYARPGQMAEFNGERAYESYAGRNDALGIDLYQNITRMARPFLSYFSPSETVWFGLEHLNLGYRDFSRLPTAADGIFFGPYREGQPGMQLEHIPPYVTTLNPGWDPSLPLYKPLGMFKAAQAALHRPHPLPWDHIQKSPPRPSPPAPTQDAVAFAGDIRGDLYTRLYALGVPFVPGGEDGESKTLIVDGEHPTADASARSMAMTARGGAVLILVRDQQAAIDPINALLPVPATLTARAATQLDHGVPGPWADSFSVPDLYFAEDAVDRHIQKCGIGGPFATQGRVLLTAGNTDWALFNDNAETAKCGAVVLYEHLEKPSGAALVAMPQGPGLVALSTLDYVPDSDAYVAFWRQLLSNIGIRMQPVRQKWLLPTAVQSDTGYPWHYTTDKPGNDWTQPPFNDHTWKTGPAGFGDDVPASRPRTPWHTDDIWLRTEFAATAEDLKDLKLMVHHDEDVEVFVNGTQIYSAAGFVTQYQVVVLSPDALKAFHPGSNTVAVHCHQTAGGQYVDVGFVSGATIRPSAAPTGHDLLLNGPQGQ